MHVDLLLLVGRQVSALVLLARGHLVGILRAGGAVSGTTGAVGVSLRRGRSRGVFEVFVGFLVVVFVDGFFDALVGRVHKHVGLEWEM